MIGGLTTWVNFRSVVRRFLAVDLEDRSRRCEIRHYLELCETPLRMAAFFLVKPPALSLRRRLFILGPLNLTASGVFQAVIATLAISLNTPGSATLLFTALIPQATPKKNRASARASCVWLSVPSTYAL